MFVYFQRFPFQIKVIIRSEFERWFSKETED